MNESAMGKSFAICFYFLKNASKIPVFLKTLPNRSSGNDGSCGKVLNGSKFCTIHYGKFAIFPIIFICQKFALSFDDGLPAGNKSKEKIIDKIAR